MPVWLIPIINSVVGIALKYLTSDVAKKAVVNVLRQVAAALLDVAHRTNQGPLSGVDDQLAQRFSDVVEDIASALGVPK